MKKKRLMSFEIFIFLMIIIDSMFHGIERRTIEKMKASKLIQKMFFYLCE